MNYYNEAIMIVAIIVVSIIALKYFGYLKCTSAPPSSNTGDNNNYNDNEEILTSFGRAVSLAPTETRASDNNYFVSTPETPLPTKIPDEPASELIVPNNTVVLMSTLEKFPWKQIPFNVTYLEIDVEAFIGPQESENFLIVSAGEGLLNIYSLHNQIVMTFGNISTVLTETGFTSRPVPIGAFNLTSKIRFHEKDKLFMDIEAQAQVGDKQLKVNPNIIKKSFWGYDVRTQFQTSNPQMYQGINVNSLQTTVKWKTTEKK